MPLKERAADVSALESETAERKVMLTREGILERGDRGEDLREGDEDVGCAGVQDGQSSCARAMKEVLANETHTASEPKR